MPWLDTRGRLTIPDLVEILFALAFLGGLAVVFFQGIRRATPHMSVGATYAWQLFYPVAVLVLLSVVYRKAAAGGGA